MAYPLGFTTVGWLARRVNIELLKLGGARRIRRSEVDLFMAVASSTGSWCRKSPTLSSNRHLRQTKTFNKSGELLAVLVAVATRPLLARSLVFTFATLLTTHSASLQLAYTPLLYGILG